MKRCIVCIGVAALFLAQFLSQAASAKADLGEQVLEEINLARAEPQLYADYIREWRKHFKGKFYQFTGSNIRRQTREGIPALNEAIDFLDRQKSLPPLEWSPVLFASAAEMVREQEKTRANEYGGKGRHAGRQGSGQGNKGKKIGYSPNESRLLVMQLIVDDGIPDRGHRQNLFSSHFKQAGVACGPHQLFGTICVADFSAGFNEHPPPVRQ